MQPLKSRFLDPDGGVHGSVQGCLRTDDLDEVGDGRHLTFFEMVGNFSFHGPTYDRSVELWHDLLGRLHVPVSHITVHPDRPDHRRLWERRGYRVRPDLECVWSDGAIGGHCTEVYVGELEVGNLVNTLGHSTDVGFGLDRLMQVVEGVSRVDETSLFDRRFCPVGRDHVRALTVLHEQGIAPGPRHREYVVRRILRRLLPLLPPVRPVLPFDGWIEHEVQLRERCLRQGRRLWRRHGHQPVRWWWESCGLLPEEVRLLGG